MNKSPSPYLAIRFKISKKLLKKKITPLFIIQLERCLRMSGSDGAGFLTERAPTAPTSQP